MKTPRFAAVPLFGLMLVLASCAKTEAGSEKAAAAPETAVIVPVVKAARTDLVNGLALTAEFEPFQQIDVMAKVAGYVQSIKVDIGDRVREGQLLATLEIPEMEDDLAKSAASIDQANAEIATASDELHRAEVAHELAHLSYTRIADVLKKEPGLVPQQEVDEARSRDLIAEAQIATAKSTLRTAEQRVSRGRGGPDPLPDAAQVHDHHGAVRRRGHQALRQRRIDDSGRHGLSNPGHANRAVVAKQSAAADPARSGIRRLTCPRRRDRRRACSHARTGHFQAAWLDSRTKSSRPLARWIPRSMFPIPR